jgi:hypothetical protein
LYKLDEGFLQVKPVVWNLIRLDLRKVEVVIFRQLPKQLVHRGRSRFGKFVVEDEIWIGLSQFEIHILPVPLCRLVVVERRGLDLDLAYD